MASSLPGPPEEPLAALVPPDGAGEAPEIPIRSPVARIGQGAQNDITIDDDTVSTNHARLEYDAGGWRLTDLESRNGTYLEGVRLAPGVPTPLTEGAVVGLGAVRLQFRIRPEADLDHARAAYAPPGEKRSLTERSGFRLPVWLLILVVILTAAIIALVLSFGADPPPAPPPAQSDVTLAAPAPERDVA